MSATEANGLCVLTTYTRKKDQNDENNYYGWCGLHWRERG
jgi:hypothetical protein